MQQNTMIVVLISFLIVFFMFFVFSTPLLKFIGFVIKTCIGAGLIYICNIIFASFNINIGLNILTASIVGFLGLPGLGSLMIMSHILCS